MGGLSYGSARPAVAQVDLATVGRYMFWLMYRNVASDGLVFDDPVNPGVVSAPGCVLASPSWENSATHVTQDYVYHWTRDAAVVALELAWAYANGTRRPWTNQTDGPALQTIALLAMYRQLDPPAQAIAVRLIDAVTGFEKSVANLSWSYAAFLSAVRARTAAS
jgi:glucoamylase